MCTVGGEVTEARDHQTNPDWKVYFEPRGYAELMPSWLPNWQGDGILANQLTDERDRIARWMRSLPRPIGVLGYNDDRGLQVHDACRAISARVPEEIAVMGIDNDEFLCNLAQPPLTSVQANVQEVGYRAAEQLQRMMTRKRVIPAKLQVQSQSLIPRRSTEMLAFDDPEVKQAVQFIRAHASEPITIASVLAHVPLSRRRLEQRFQQTMGHTLHDEISRVRLGSHCSSRGHRHW